jgi:hypothetical protein
MILMKTVNLYKKMSKNKRNNRIFKKWYQIFKLPFPLKIKDKNKREK